MARFLLLGNAGNNYLSPPSNLGPLDSVYARGYEGDDYIRGSNQADTILGDSGYDWLFGRGGDDKIYGGTGSDLIEGGDGNDTAFGGSESDDIYGDAGDDKIYGGTENDYLDGGDGNDIVRGESGDDHIKGGLGNDTLLGGAGNDYIVTGVSSWAEPPEEIPGETQSSGFYFDADDVDIANGGDGNDVIQVEGGRATVVGGNGNDALYGSWGKDILNGGNDDDWISGGGGPDLLIGGLGNDTLLGGVDSVMVGGTGEDKFVFSGINGTVGSITASGFDKEDTLYLNLSHYEDFTPKCLTIEGDKLIADFVNEVSYDDGYGGKVTYSTPVHLEWIGVGKLFTKFGGVIGAVHDGLLDFGDPFGGKG